MHQQPTNIPTDRKNLLSYTQPTDKKNLLSYTQPTDKKKPTIVHTSNVQIEIHRKKQEEEEAVKTKTISTAVHRCNNVCNKNQN